MFGALGSRKRFLKVQQPRGCSPANVPKAPRTVLQPQRVTHRKRLKCDFVPGEGGCMLRGRVVGMRDLKGIFSGKIGIVNQSKLWIFWQNWATVRSCSIRRNTFEKATMPPQCNCRTCKRHVGIHFKKTLYIHGYIHACISKIIIKYICIYHEVPAGASLHAGHLWGFNTWKMALFIQWWMMRRSSHMFCCVFLRFFLPRVWDHIHDGPCIIIYQKRYDIHVFQKTNKKQPTSAHLKLHMGQTKSGLAAQINPLFSKCRSGGPHSQHLAHQALHPSEIYTPEINTAMIQLPFPNTNFFWIYFTAC